MNQFQVHLLKHLNDGKTQFAKNPYDPNISQQDDRKRSQTQTSQNTISTIPFTQADGTPQQDTKVIGFSDQDYIPESNEYSTKKRYRLNSDPSKDQQLATPSRVNQSQNLQTENGNSHDQRSYSTDYSSKKKNRTQSRQINESIFKLRQKVLDQSTASDEDKKQSQSDKDGEVVQRIMRFESFYNFSKLYDQEERESRRRSKEYSEVVQERHELWRNRSHSASQQRFIKSIIENGKKDYKTVKRQYSSSVMKSILLIQHYRYSVYFLDFYLLNIIIYHYYFNQEIVSFHSFQWYLRKLYHFQSTISYLKMIL